MKHHVIVPATAYAMSRASTEIDGVIRAHMGIVRKIAWQVHGSVSSAIAVEDLIQTGLVALVEAARGFEERGAAFAPYAATRVRGAMIDQLRREARIGRTGMANRKRLAAVRRSLENENCRPASDADMASALDITAEAYHAMVQSSQPLQFDPVDDIYSDSSPWFADLADNPEQQLLEGEIEDRLAEAISGLEQRSAMVLQLYFKEGLNLAEIAQVMNVSAPRICQIKRDALARVRNRLSDLIDG